MKLSYIHKKSGIVIDQELLYKIYKDKRYIVILQPEFNIDKQEVVANELRYRFEDIVFGDEFELSYPCIFSEEELRIMITAIDNVGCFNATFAELMNKLCSEIHRLDRKNVQPCNFN